MLGNGINVKSRKLRLACDLAVDRVVAARADKGLVDQTVVREIGRGAIVPHLTGPNLAMREVVRTGVEEALAAVAGRSRDVAVVIPDGACRVVLLDFDALPEKHDEAEAVVRFRLKKSLPFDVDRARVCYQLQPSDDNRLNVLAAVVLNSVLEEYESVVREAGYLPGVVLPAMIAALGQVDAGVPTLVIKIDPTTTSVAIVDRDRLALLRTLDNPAGARPQSQQLAEDIYPSLVFYQDTYGTKVDKILMNAPESLEGLSRAVEEYTGVRVQELVRTDYLAASVVGDRLALSGVVGALAP